MSKREVKAIPNVGPAVARMLICLGIERPDDLRGHTADHLYRRLCEKDGHRHDPCILDTLTAGGRLCPRRARPTVVVLQPIAQSACAGMIHHAVEMSDLRPSFEVGLRLPATAPAGRLGQPKAVRPPADLVL